MPQKKGVGGKRGVNARKAKRMSLIQKDTREQRSSTKQLSSPSIYHVQRSVELLKPWELSPTQRFKTYYLMSLDPDIAASLETRRTSIETAQSKYKLKYDKNSERSLYLKGFIEFCFKNMKRSMRSVARDASEMIANGISPLEIVTRLEKEYPEYIGMFVLDDLSYIDPMTIDPIVPYTTKNGGRDIEYWRQVKSAFSDRSLSLTRLQFSDISTVGAVELDARKVAVCAYNTKSSLPLGNSILDAAYSPWREKQLIQEFLLMGIQKDLAGMPLLKVPTQLLQEANADPTSAAAQTLNQLVEHLKNLHASDQSFGIIPSDTYSENGSGAQMFDFTFKGVEGNNKNFNLVEILEQKKKTIYTVLGSTDLIAGENGGGSYNLLEGKTNLKAHLSKRDNIIIDDEINKKVIPYLLRLNGLTNEKVSDIPVYTHGEVQPLSTEEASKRDQRLGAVGLLPKQDPRFLNELYEAYGWEYRFEEDISKKDLLDKLGGGEVTSRAGDGMAEGLNNGTGSSLNNNSATNSENAA